MKKTTKKYVEYLYPGLIASETSREVIDHNDPTKVNVSENAIGFRFVEQEFVIDGDEEFKGKEKNYTNWFYIGKRLTLADVEKRFGKDPKYSILISNMKNNHIDSVCMTRFGNFMSMENGDITLDEYIRKNDKEKQAIQMFENLKKHIGKTVTYHAWWYGAMESGTDELKSVAFFTNVQIGCMGMPFVGYGSAISSITLQETGEVLYSNPYIEYGYDRRCPEDIEESKRKIYGDVIVDKQRDRRIKAEEKNKLAMEKANVEAKKKKYAIMKDGITFVKPELAEEWMIYVDKNTNDAYSCGVAETSLLCLKKLADGATCKEVEQIYCEMGLTGFMAGAVSSALAHFSQRGDEFRTYWNSKFGVTEDKTNSTINPAILTLEPTKKNNSL